MDLKQLKRDRLRQYLEAESAILAGAQSYQIGSRLLTRANLAEIRQGIQNLIDEISLDEQNVNGRRKRAVFVD